MIPDPILVRAIAQRIITAEIEEIRDLSTVEIREMCEDEVSAVAAQIDPDDDLEDAEDALVGAVQAEIRAAVLAPAWPPRLAFDDSGTSVDCPLCSMYLAGLRAERRGA